MKLRNAKKWSALALLVTLGGLAAWAAAAPDGAAVTNAALLNGWKSGEWLMAAGNYEATRYSPLKQIDSSNVSKLGLAWYYDTDSLPGTLEASPVISNGTLYATVTWGAVFAVDARTGKEKWRWDPQCGPSEFSHWLAGKSGQGAHGTEPLLRTGKSRRGCV